MGLLNHLKKLLGWSYSKKEKIIYSDGFVKVTQSYHDDNDDKKYKAKLQKAKEIRDPDNQTAYKIIWEGDPLEIEFTYQIITKDKNNVKNKTKTKENVLLKKAVVNDGELYFMCYSKTVQKNIFFKSNYIATRIKCKSQYYYPVAFVTEKLKIDDDIADHLVY